MLAYIVLAFWPIFSLWLFSRLSIERAIVWTIVGGYMALPPVAAFDLPLVPALGKYTISNLSALAGCMIYGRTSVFALPRSRLVQILIVAFVASPLATSATNGDAIVLANRVLPAIRLYDAFATMIGQALFIVPFFLARIFLGTPAAHREILRVFMLGGLIYSVPMLVEIRLSPQLNTWIYGFFQHIFNQTMRAGGFRPIVFMPHGLWVAFFTMSAAVAAAALARAAPAEDKGKLLAATAYLLVLLVLCKSMASLIYAMVLIPLIFCAPVRLMTLVAFAFAAIAITYPILRGSDLIPVDALVDWALGINPERAQSLEFRFNNEDMLLDKARERLWFGWGSWGRNFVYDAFSGRNISVSDGRWIIVIGIFGWLGYIVEFGLLALPPLILGMRRAAGGVPISVGATSLILAINMFDMLPNATLLPITWMLAGAVLGYTESMSRSVSNESAMAEDPLQAGRRTRPLQSIL